MPVPNHCAKILPKVTRFTTQVHRECPVCRSLWIYENSKWTQIPFKERTIEDDTTVGL